MNSNLLCCYNFGNSQTLNSLWKLSDEFTIYNKLYLIEKGEIVVDSNGETMRVKAGEMLFIPPLINHVLRANAVSSKITYIQFSVKLGGKDLFGNYKQPLKIVLQSKARAVKLIKQIISDGNGLEPNRSLLTSAKICELVYLLKGEIKPFIESERVSGIDSAILYIDANLTEQLNLSALAEKYNCSPNHFIIKFKQKTGYTPIKYISIKRIEVAKKLLETTLLPISDVMEKVGFYDASYFSKLFKKTVGCSPREYRDNL